MVERTAAPPGDHLDHRRLPLGPGDVRRHDLLAHRGQAEPPNEAYRISPDVFAERVDEMVDAYTIREEGDTGIPVVHPPPGSDIYLLARLWEWWPILELEKDQTYRLHLSSMDWQHGFSLQPTNINLQVHPNYDMVLTIEPDEAGSFAVVCNEYCGIGHHLMLGRIYVVE
jgi:cytochrome c oxidase subunit 2